MEERRPVALRILGGLELMVGGEVVSLGGARQRAVFAALALRPNDVVSRDALIDEVWGEAASASARHALEVNISRLRRVLEEHQADARIETRSGGYALVLDPAASDLDRFRALVGEGRAAAALGDAAGASRTFAEALSLWRARPLDDVALEGSARIEVERLSELWLTVLEERIEADLALGQDAELVGELQALVEQHRYRERLCAQLMLALYRSGRQAEALAAYERTRRLLDEDLGLQPSRKLRELSARIVRQEPSLDVREQRRTAWRAVADRPPPSRSTRPRRAVAVAVGVAVGITAVGLAIAFASDERSVDRANGPARTDDVRVVLVLVGDDPSDPVDSPYLSLAIRGLREADRVPGVRTRTIRVGPPAPEQTEAERVMRGRPDLVLVLGADFRAGVRHAARRFPNSRFVVLDPSHAEDAARELDNVTEIVFAEDEAGYLVGYLSGLVERGSGQRLNSRRVVSLVGGVPSPGVRRFVAGFRGGVARALPSGRVLVDYSNTFADQAVCERIANEQIDAGSDIVFAVAGPCGFGALAAVGVRGVWGVGVDADLSFLGPHILASAVKRLDRAVLLAVRWYDEGRLPSGDITLGLEENGVGIAGISPAVSPRTRRAVAQVAAAIRAGEIASRGRTTR